MIKSLLMSTCIPSEGMRRLIAFPLDFYIEAKCKESKGYEINFFADDTEVEVPLYISQEDYDILSDEGPDDYFSGEYEHDIMALRVSKDIARFILKEFNTDNNPDKECLMFDLDNYIAKWERDIHELAVYRRMRRAKTGYKPSHDDDDEETSDE